MTLLAIDATKRVALPRTWVVWGHLWVVALRLNVVPGVLFALAKTRTTSILVGIVNAITPSTTPSFIIVVFRDEPMSPSQLTGLAVSLLGVATVQGVWRGFGRNPWWAVLALLSAVTLNDASFHSTLRNITPVVAVVGGVLFLREPLTSFNPVGGLLVLLGAAVGQGRLRPRR